MTTLMKNVFWRLGRAEFDDYDEFVAAVTKENSKVRRTKSEWEPDRPISPTPVTVSFRADWKDENDTLEVAVGEPDEPVTMGKLLFALNNASIDFFAGADRHFFEGVTFVSEATYRLDVGS